MDLCPPLQFHSTIPHNWISLAICSIFGELMQCSTQYPFMFLIGQDPAFQLFSIMKNMQKNEQFAMNVEKYVTCNIHIFILLK